MITEFIIKFFGELVALTNDMSFWLLLGFLIAGILYAWFPQGKVKKYLGGNNTKSVVNSAIMGVPLPLCSCGVIPTGVSFYKNGASKGSAVSFLISTPQTGVDSILITYSMLGLPMAVVRPIVAFITGIAGGLFTNRSSRKEARAQTIESTQMLDDQDKRNPFIKMFHYGFVEFLEDIAKWLVIGLLIAALIAVALPANFFETYIQNDIWGMLLILVASIPLYVCATSSVPIAAVLMLKGISPGAALVFLMAGPATNAATIAVIGKSMGRKTLFTYMATIIGGALLSGLAIDYLLPEAWFLNAISQIHGGHEQHLIPLWLKYASSIILSLLVFYSFIRKYLPKKQSNILKSSNDMGQLTLTVKGMNCNHCKTNVTNSLNRLEGIEVKDVDLSNEQVVISSDNPDLEKIKQTVEDIGYTFGGKN
jgi:hypothetical protein